MRVIWFVTMCTFVSGCASYHPASLPGVESKPISGESEVVVQRGSKVRITTRVYAVIEGEVSEITDDQLSVVKAGNYGREERVVSFEDIRSIEVEQGSNTTTVLLVSAVVVGVAVIVLVGEGIKASVPDD